MRRRGEAMLSRRECTEQGLGSGRPMPARRFPPVDLDYDGTPWCSQCDGVVGL